MLKAIIALHENDFAAVIVHLFEMFDRNCFFSGGAGWWSAWGSEFISSVRNKVVGNKIAFAFLSLRL